MSGGPRILFLPDFGPTVGGGHALRCFTLAQALMDKGATCAAALDDAAGQALVPFLPHGVDCLPLGAWPQTAQGFGAVVIDNYRTGVSEEVPLANAGLKIAVIDDLADRLHVCDLLLDPGYGRETMDYARMVPPGTELLLGPSYALLRPEFAAARSAALHRRKDVFGRRVLISLGLTDVGGHTGKIAQLLSGLVAMDVVLGSSAPSLPLVRDLPGVTLHVDARNMAELIAKADVGVGGGGSSTWERACLGLPSISLILADNQAEMARRLHEDGVVIAIDAREPGYETHVVAAVERLFSDEALRTGLCDRAARLCDGQGASRVADALLAKLG